MDIFDKYDFTEDRLTPKYNDRERKDYSCEFIQYINGLPQADKRDCGR